MPKTEQESPTENLLDQIEDSAEEVEAEVENAAETRDTSCKEPECDGRHFKTMQALKERLTDIVRTEKIFETFRNKNKVHEFRY